MFGKSGDRYAEVHFGGETDLAGHPVVITHVVHQLAITQVLDERETNDVIGADLDGENVER